MHLRPPRGIRTIPTARHPDASAALCNKTRPACATHGRVIFGVVYRSVTSFLHHAKMPASSIAVQPGDTERVDINALK